MLYYVLSTLYQLFWYKAMSNALSKQQIAMNYDHMITVAIIFHFFV